MRFYTFVLFGSHALAPLLAEFITKHLEWKAAIWFETIVVSVTTVIIFFGMEETIYFRSVVESVSDDPPKLVSKDEKAQEAIEYLAGEKDGGYARARAKTSDSRIASAGGSFLWAFGAAHQVHCIGEMFALLFLSFGMVVGATTALAYNVDCFKDICGEKLILVMIVRNTMRYRMAYGIKPWLQRVAFRLL
ncbi:hypothetical protein LTR84_001068 [Exophiala bonariae]|uniref:Major facilitator superfamily (MFS) profile domain-containing protein n=1 Tax=Exophiala bonariae TaxID=1690606 RepID=A0AAV9NSX3_9EURO|nr:hypothetical protein LTR84_001068 [Exophiala bonariae]